ncbi:augmin subunit 4 isoform X2, partial [Tanacetum coccineum]
MSARLRVLEHILLLETYTQESVLALHKISLLSIAASHIKLAAVNENKNPHLHRFLDACKGIPQRSKGEVAEAAELKAKG